MTEAEKKKLLLKFVTAVLNGVTIVSDGKTQLPVNSTGRKLAREAQFRSQVTGRPLEETAWEVLQEQLAKSGKPV